MTNIFPIDFEEKLTMAQDDYILFSDSEDGNKIKKAQYKNLKGEPGTPGTPGADGQDGTSATITVGSTTTGAAGTNASVTNTGTSSAAVLDFVIPQGAKGEDGEDGAAATITVGTTTTLPAGSSATVTNSGTSSAAVLNFGIPKGDTGTQDAKVFALSSTSDLTTAQSAYDWYANGKEAIILYSGRYYYFKSTGSGSVYFAVNEYTTLDNTDVTSLVQKTLTLALSGTTVTSVSSWNMSLTNYNVLRTGKDYGTPYTPQYNGSPATKKYVDDSVSGAIYSGSSAPATPSEGQLWYDTTNDILKVYDGSNWDEVGSGTGDVVGPASATDGHLAVFDGATGKLIKDGGAIPTGVPSGGTDGQVLSKVSGNIAWANPSGGGDVVVSTDTGNELSTGVGLWLGTETDFSSISTPDSNTLYIQYKSNTITERPDITSAVYDNKYVSITGTENQGVCFSLDGLNMYYCDFSGRDVIQYSLSTAWDVSTATNSNKSYDTGTNVSGVAINDTGTYLFISSNGSGIRKYTLSTPYDVSTASLTETLSVSGNLTGISISSDGTKLYYMNYTNSKIIEYSLPSAWTLTGATLVGDCSYPVAGNVYRDCAVSSLGGKVFMVDQNNTSHIYQMDMATDYNITTASYNSLNISLSYNACGLYVKPDGTKMYVVDTGNNEVKQYSLV